MTRVLVVDDDDSVRSAIEVLLLQRDCSVVLADSGEIARTFEKSDFDVIVLDIVMPGMDGLEALKIFRERAPLLPIVVMSGFRFSGAAAGAPDFLRMASALGANCCLRKPFTPDQLMGAISSSICL